MTSDQEFVLFQDVIDNLHPREIEMLKLINYRTSLTSSEIQHEMNFNARQSNIRYQNKLLKKQLIKKIHDPDNKKRRLYSLTSKGHGVVQSLLYLDVQAAMQVFYTYCEEVFLTEHPNFKGSAAWRAFKQQDHYSEKVFIELETRVKNFILEILQEDHPSLGDSWWRPWSLLVRVASNSPSTPTTIRAKNIVIKIARQNTGTGKGASKN